MGWDVQKSPPIHLDPVGVSCLRCPNSWSSMKCLVPNSDPLKTQTFWLPAICIPKTGSIRPCQGSFCSPKIGFRENGVHGSPVRPTRVRVVVCPIRCLSPVFFISFQNISTETQIVNIKPGSLLTTSSSLCSACDAPQHGLKLVEVQVPGAASARRRRSMQHQQSQSIASPPLVLFLVNSLLVNSRLLFLLPRVPNCCLRWRTKIPRNKTR